jgi:hypothetical protein
MRRHFRSISCLIPIRRLNGLLAALVLTFACSLQAHAFQQGGTDPYRNMGTPAFISQNPYTGRNGDLDLWYVWGCCDTEGWQPAFVWQGNELYYKPTNGRSMDYTPEVGGIMWYSGGLAYIVRVIDANHWVVDLYQWWTPTTWQELEVTREEPDIIGFEDGGGFYLFGISHPPHPVTSPWTQRQGDRLAANQVLGPNQYLESQNGVAVLYVQGDGNLVLYDHFHGGWVPLWATGTVGAIGDYLVPQSDGNLVLYLPGGKPIWATGTVGWGPIGLIMQDDYNCVIYNAYFRPLWATNTVR